MSLGLQILAEILGGVTAGLVQLFHSSTLGWLTPSQEDDDDMVTRALETSDKYAHDSTSAVGRMKDEGTLSGADISKKA